MARLSSLGSIGRSVRNLVARGPKELDPVAAYELWAASYDDIDNNALLHSEAPIVNRLLQQIELGGKSILDAGCGTGRYLSAIQQFHPRLLAGIDLSPAMLGHAQEKSRPDMNPVLGVASVENLPFRDGVFDIVLSTLVLGHVRNLGGAITELSRVMQRKGTILISCFHPFGKLLSWNRSFQGETAPGEKAWFSATYYLHLYADYFNALAAARIQILQVHEPVIDESVKPFYDRAGRLDIYKQYKGYPLLLIFLARKQ